MCKARTKVIQMGIDWCFITRILENMSRWTMAWFPTVRYWLGIMLMLGISICGAHGFVLASNTIDLLQFQHKHVTLNVRQLSLRTILDQLHDQLEVDYQAPKDALDTLISVNMHWESIPHALATILAPWNYALQRDSAGHVQHIFIVRKIAAGGPAGPSIMAESAQDHLSKHPLLSKKFRAFSEELGDESDWAFPSRKNPEHEAADESFAKHGMGHLPPLGYSSMEIEQVSEEAQEAILDSFHSGTSSFIDKGSPKAMPIIPISEDDKRRILRSLTPTIGNPGNAPIP